MDTLTIPGRIETYLDGLLPVKLLVWLRGLARSRDKLKPLYLNYYSTYGHENWQDGHLF